MAWVLGVALLRRRPGRAWRSTAKELVGTGTPTISGGNGYLIGDIIFDPYGGIYKVTNQSGGASLPSRHSRTATASRASLVRRHAARNPVATTSWFQDFTPRAAACAVLEHHGNGSQPATRPGAPS